MTRSSLSVSVCLLILLAASASAVQDSAWERHIQAGRQAWQAGRLAEAEEHFNAALNEAAGFGPRDPRLAESLHLSASLHLASGRFLPAESLARHALEIREEVLGPGHPLVAESLNLLATVHHLAGELEKAEALYLRSLAIGGKALGMTDPNVAANLFSLSALYTAQGRRGEAITLHRWALAVWGAKLGTDHPLYRQMAEQDDHVQEMHRHSGHGSATLNEAEMGPAEADSAPPPLADILARQDMDDFALDYFSAGAHKRPVFEKHYDALGARGILDFLESANPMCHEEAHDLGQVVLARSESVGAALRQCLTRCTSACMHGILKGALAEKPAAGSPAGASLSMEAVRETAALCDDPVMARIHKPGNCAHGMGHAFLMNTRYDLAPALAACSAFKDTPMQYHCATGIFMEYLFTGRPQDPRLDDLEFPCDTIDRFPAACYRYKVFEMIRKFGEDREKAVAVCLGLPRARRLGCFHGIGASYVRAVFDDPGLIADVCRQGNADDQTMCVEGVVEKLAEYDEAHALAACAKLEGGPAAVCRAAAKEKMYRLDKPSFPLYFAQ